MKKLFLLALLLSSATFFSTQVFAQSGGQNPSLIMYRWNGGGISPQPVVQGNLLGTVRWDGLTGVGSIKTGASIQSFVKNPVAPGFLMGNMIFRTSGPAGLTDQVIITENGLVGIGEMNPQYNLHVLGNTHTTGDFFGRIHFDDNQSNNYLPNDYIDEAYFELKQRGVLSGANTLPLSANIRGGVLSLAPGQGSLDHQLFFGDDGVWNRIQAGVNSWGNWYRFLTSENINGHAGRLPRFTGTLGAVSSSLGDSQIFDDGVDNVVIGENHPPTPPAAFNTNYRLTVNGLPLPNGAAYINGNTFINNGNLGIGKTPTDFDLDVAGESNFDGRVKIGAIAFPTFVGAAAYELAVGGGIIAEEVLVRLQGSWADYVFEKDYTLMPLADVEKFVEENNHLPGIASAKEVAENGLNLGEMQKAQMEKIEELYLHLIEMNKQMQALKAENEALKSHVAELEKR